MKRLIFNKRPWIFPSALFLLLSLLFFHEFFGREKIFSSESLENFENRILEEKVLGFNAGEEKNLTEDFLDSLRARLILIEERRASFDSLLDWARALSLEFDFLETSGLSWNGLLLGRSENAFFFAGKLSLMANEKVLQKFEFERIEKKKDSAAVRFHFLMTPRPPKKGALSREKFSKEKILRALTAWEIPFEENRWIKNNPPSKKEANKNFPEIKKRQSLKASASNCPSKSPHISGVFLGKHFWKGGEKYSLGDSLDGLLADSIGRDAVRFRCGGNFLWSRVR